MLLDAHDLAGFIDAVVTPSQLITDAEGRSVSNPSYLSFVKQNKLLTSWLISTISGDLLSVFIGSTTTHQIWCKATRLFAATSDVKVERLKHELHSVAKGDRCGGIRGLGEESL